MNIGIPTIFIIFLIFVFIFQHRLKKSEKLSEKKNKEFWDKEYKSLVVRKKEIDPSFFIKINPDELPTNSLTYFKSKGNANLYNIQQSCINCLSYPMMNLNNMLNSDIRLKFGSANLSVVQSYEENFNQFIKLLYKLGKGYYEIGEPLLAIKILNLAINNGVVISKYFLLLGEIYNELNKKDEIKNLINILSKHDTITGPKTIQVLNNYIN